MTRDESNAALQGTVRWHWPSKLADVKCRHTLCEWSLYLWLGSDSSRSSMFWRCQGGILEALIDVWRSRWPWEITAQNESDGRRRECNKHTYNIVLMMTRRSRMKKKNHGVHLMMLGFVSRSFEDWWQRMVGSWKLDGGTRGLYAPKRRPGSRWGILLFYFILDLELGKIFEYYCVLRGNKRVSFNTPYPNQVWLVHYRTRCALRILIGKIAFLFSYPFISFFSDLGEGPSSV